ncbi:ZDS1 [Auxenochlorella protothecoides x Auxenochlorella symbiontica]|uniref:Zeta-carotene desaturase n=1 Tax=Auxenochlorella protothecoides TaxID=3075 RepID=A0A087SD88_AUXPR|nr:Zeta-carotene desaturase, chloroplastic/chromoplastic [Auxenochlorella protothecoides]KFM23692.1 Zeta-carotene desaturase, chloroplastic/chromoplastic [Auxenochlorella protothecoides]
MSAALSFHPLYQGAQSRLEPRFCFRGAVASRRAPLYRKRVDIAAAAIAAPASNVEDVGLKDAPLRSLYPEEPSRPEPGAPRLKVAIVGGGLAGLSTAVELLDQGYEVDIYESRPWIGGKVASFKDKEGNHIEMGLHVFFGCYHNLFRLMAKCGVLENLLVKEHTHKFVNAGGDVRNLDFRFNVGSAKIGAPFHGLKAFFTTPQLSTVDKLSNSLALGTSPIVRALFDPEGGMQSVRRLDGISFADWFRSHGGSQGSIDRMWDPIAYALGFLDCEDISARCMLTIFQFFATKTDASVLRMLNGSPADRLLRPITDYITAKGGRLHTRWGCREVLYETDAEGAPTRVKGLRMSKADSEKTVTADVYVAALDVPGAKRLIPQAWRRDPFFDNIFQLEGVAVITVQLRYDGWVTELREASNKGEEPAGLNNLLYSADADFSCFADLALTSPVDYFKEGQGSLMQCVLTPAAKYMPMENAEIAAAVDAQVKKLFPSAASLQLQWHSIVKIGQSLYREAPGMDVFRPDQKTPIPNFYLAGSYTKQDYIDSMEGATLSGRQCAYKILGNAPELLEARPQQAPTQEAQPEAVGV